MCLVNEMLTSYTTIWNEFTDGWFCVKAMSDVVELCGMWCGLVLDC
jgi:hypothetical protein